MNPMQKPTIFFFTSVHLVPRKGTTTTQEYEEEEEKVALWQDDALRSAEEEKVRTEGVVSLVSPLPLPTTTTT